MTLPLEPSTLPKRTATYLVRRSGGQKQHSAMRLVAPMMLVGGRFIGRDHDEVFDSCSAAATATLYVPRTLFLDGLKDVRLHHGDVLIGRGVIHHEGE